MDSEWTYIREPVESHSMVLKGLIPDTGYQFIIRSVNEHGISPPSPINPPVHTLAVVEAGSGDHRPHTPHSADAPDVEDETFSIDDSDYDIVIDEIKQFSTMKNSRRSQLRSHGAVTDNGHVTHRINAPRYSLVLQNTPGSSTMSDLQFTPVSRNTSESRSTHVLKNTPENQMTPQSVFQNTPVSITTPVPGNYTSLGGVWTFTATPTPTRAAPTTNSTISTTASTSSITDSTVTADKRPKPRVFDTLCDRTVCPSDSFCVNHYDRGGSRCHCNLGHHGVLCSQGVSIRFPRFYGYSHMTFEPLRNSYQLFHITLEFRADSENGLLLYCGEDERGGGDFISLALIRRKLHYRFNCGTGAGQMISQSLIVIGRWYNVTLYRNGVNGWLQLDNNTPVLGRSQGHYSKITFRTPLFVGGAPSVYWLVKAVGTNRGFHGCVQKLLINDRPVDLRPWPQGHALSGGDIGECSTSVCVEVVCKNGGICYPTSANTFICLCPLGYRGAQCEESFVLTLPHFSERVQSYASAPWPQSFHSYLSFMEIHVTFRPTNQDGTLLYSHDSYSRDFLSIILVGGVVEFRFDCGSGATIIRSEQPVSKNVWHDLRVSRTARSGILQVDDQRPVEGSTEGAFTQVKCTSPLFVGGVPDYEETKLSAGVTQPFSGDVQRITLNDHPVVIATGHAVGVNVMNAPHPCVQNPCANGGTCRPKREGYECDCRLGYAGSHCQRECENYCYNVTDVIEIPQFTGRSYLTYDNQDILKRVSGLRTSVFLHFKSLAADGLLLWRGENTGTNHTDYISIGLQEGALVFSFNLGSGSASVLVNGTFSDGRWHRVKAVRDGQFGKITVDDYGAQTGRSAGNMRQLNVNGELYIGGMKEVALHTGRQYLAGLVGCVSHFTLSTNYHVSLVESAADGKNINTCTN
ncbi:pikachurin isoform X2 [Trichomycterus rosablanca]|uniref:pikachurin isoform X2 n=1 Tax=Trichomycterus rosablanca TaxID=2290929 RepID=UPI002F34F8E7